jgi:hypothetical protein
MTQAELVRVEAWVLLQVFKSCLWASDLLSPVAGQLVL